MGMYLNVDALSAADGRYTKKMDAEDRNAMRLCLFSVGALTGLSLRGSLTRRVAALGCTLLAAGLAIPLAKEYVDELKTAPTPVEPLDS